jgi:hypothetical protein
MPLVFFVITVFFGGLLRSLLPYMKCLLYGYNSLHNFALSGDRPFGVNTESCHRVHRLLERAGRAYASNLVKMLSTARAINLVRGVIDLSVDGLHIPYDGKKRVRDWGTPFSTLMSKAYPGLYPITAVDLASGLILYAGSFVRAGTKECKKHLGNVVAPRVMESIALLKKAGIEVRSLVADEGITSHKLMDELIGRGIDHYILAIRANSKLRKFESWIGRWKKLGDRGRVIGLLRNVGYYGQTTNLLMVKDRGKAFLYISSLADGPKQIWKRFCRRGNHERKHGVASTMGIKSLPSNRLFQIEGHILTCVYLNLILKKLCGELNLGEIDVETLRSIFTRECYIRWEEDGKKIHALIVANKALLKKLGKKHTITWSHGTIRFVYYRERNAPNILNGL